MLADGQMPKLASIAAHRHKRTLSSELSMTPRRAPESPMGANSPSVGSPASENKPKPWPGIILYGEFNLCCEHRTATGADCGLYSVCLLALSVS